ncbi:Hypp9691 [Branchiostoma lanceolatum]|uniref:Hypp9691 protein n=1 Tax=Branchiostoma lanceolatum TaxID=7740 RepID=A0A8S4MPI6_BRALA|nr:Hypp9691 [Branchiostoma lanceolatum]
MAARKKGGRKKNGRPHRAGQFRKGQKPWNKGLDLMQVKAISSYRRPTEDQEGLYVNKDRAGNILQNDTETLNEVGRTMVLRPTKLAGSRIARFLGKKVDSDEVEGYRIWHAKTAVRACASAQRDHDKHQPDCEGLVRLSFKGEIKKGLATVETLVCDTCKYASPKRKFYTETKRPGPGAKIAVPNLAVQIAMFNSPIGVRVLREMAAALDLPVPSKSGLQKMANRYSDLMVKKNEDDMETWRETIYDIHLQKGNPPGSGIPAEIDTRYQTPLRSARGKKPGQPSPNSVTSLAENVTPKKLALAVHVRNKICPTRNLNEGLGKPVPAHKCPANIPEEAVIGDEKQAARDVAKKMLSGRRKTPVGQLVEDGDSSSSKGFKEVMMEETGQKVTAFKDIVHLGKGVRNRVTTTKWSKEMFPGQDQLERNRVRDRFGNDLCKRLNTEHKLARKRFPQKKKMAAKMKQVMEAIPYCYAGDHDRCVAGSLDRGRNLTTIKHTDFLDTSPSESGEYTQGSTVSVTDPTEEVDASTAVLTEEDDSADESDPVEEVREIDDPLILTCLEDDRYPHSEQVQSVSLESSTPAFLGKENTRRENPVTHVPRTPQRKGRKGLTKPLQLFQPAQPSALTRDEASKPDDHLTSTVSKEGKLSGWSKNLRILLGDIQEVETFDSLKKKMKEKRVSQDTKTSYDRSIALLQVKVSKCHSSLKMDLKEWERDFMSHNNCACPTLDDLDNAPVHVKEILRRMKIATTLMKAFGMKGL